jgi:hypothetical protein
VWRRRLPASLRRALGSTTHIALDIDDTLPVSGTVCCADGTAHPFTGWTGLFGMLRALVLSAPSLDPDRGNAADDAPLDR